MLVNNDFLVDKEKIGYKLFDVLIGSKLYPVVNIDSKTHAGLNDTPKTWWVYINRELVPYCIKSLHRLCFGVNYTQHNSTKFKYNSLIFRKGGLCKITCNNKPFYEFSSYSLEFAMAKVSTVITELCEFPGYNFINPEENNGKVIKYKGVLGTMQSSKSRPWEFSFHWDPNFYSLETWQTKLYQHRIYDVDLEEFIADNLHNNSLLVGDAYQTNFVDWYPDSELI